MPRRAIKVTTAGPTSYVDPRYHDLTVLGLITPSGEVDSRALEDVTAALRCPHGDQVRQSRFFHLRQAERQMVADNESDDYDNYLSDQYAEDRGPPVFPPSRRSRSPNDRNNRRSASPMHGSNPSDGTTGPSTGTVPSAAIGLGDDPMNPNEQDAEHEELHDYVV
ncbi:hypothetical protein H0H87_010374 [Tephrocybe sp. NHM501043]|nr:hypothetical protein H0H87_010374 [Tephrocybe sp. NHM501043]